MDAKRFDDLSRLLGRGLSRRGAIRAAIGAIVGAVGAGALPDDAGAASRCRVGGYQCTRNGQCCTGVCVTGPRIPRTQRNRCKCEAGLVLCGTRCVSLTSTRHCGGCGVRCRADEQCCNGTCVRLGTDANCARCGNTCALADTCWSGACVRNTPCLRVTCSGSTTCCGGTCVDLQSSGANCGACGTVCPTGVSCVAGVCVDPCASVTCDAGETCVSGTCKCGANPTCGATEACCAGSCIGISDSEQHCGACHSPCDTGETCISGTCKCGANPACANDETCCSGACVDTDIDESHCGACNDPCAIGETCCSGGCVDTSLDEDHCGACNDPCANGDTCCSGGCVDTDASEDHCGACNDPCDTINGETCCDAQCIDTQSATANCGACGTACDPGETCGNGTCLCSPACDGTNCGEDDGCGGTCPPYANPDDESVCVDAAGFCNSTVWRTGNRARCATSPQGEVLLVCYNSSRGYNYRLGANCTQTSECQTWCDEEEDQGCICTDYVYEGAGGFQDYAIFGNYCVRKVGLAFDLQDAIDGDCGSI